MNRSPPVLCLSCGYIMEEFQKCSVVRESVVGREIKGVASLT